MAIQLLTSDTSRLIKDYFSEERTLITIQK